MSTDHKGNIQPGLDMEEHATISGVAGKKVFNVDSDGNVINYGNVTVDGIAQAWPDPKSYIGLVTITGSLAPAEGNVTIDSIAQAWPDPKSYIGLVTITGSLAAASGNITLDPGSKTQIAGNVTIDSQTAWTDPKTYIGLVTITGSLAAAAGNITLDPGSSTQIIGNVTVEQGTDPWATSFSGNVTLDPGSQTQIIGNTTIEVGTGALDLGKAVDEVVGAADTGVAILGKHQEDSIHLTTADGDYDNMHLDSRGALVANVEQHHVFDTFNATTDWTVLGNDTDNLITTKKHVTGTDALSFDKVDGAADTVFAGIQKTLSSVDLGNVAQHDLMQGTFYIPELALVDYVFLRLGTNSTNYNEWQLPDTALTEGIFEVGALSIGDADYDAITGDGWDPSAITYIAVGVAFDAAANLLAGIVFDEVSYHTNQHASAQINAEVSSSVSTANINVHRVGGTPTSTNIGNAAAATQRVVLASDQPIVETSNTGNITVEQGDDPWQTAQVGNVTIDSGNISIIGNVTVDQVDVVTAVTNITNPVALKGNLTIDSGSISIIGNVTVEQADDPWVTSNVGNITVEQGDDPWQTSQVGNVTIDSGSISLVGNVTLSDPKTYIGLVTVGNTVATTFAGNVTLDPGSQTAIVGNVSISSNTAWPDPKTYIGLVTITGSLDAAAGNVTLDPGSQTGIVGNITLSDPKGFIGLVTIVGSLAPAAGNITLDPGSSTQITGNITVDQVDVVTAVTDITNPVALKGNLTLSDAKTYIGLTTSTIGNTVTVDMAGNNDVTVTGNVTLSDSKTYIGLTTTTPATAWPDPKTYIGLVTITGSLAAAAGNITLDPGSQTGIIGNVTVDQVDVVTTVTAVTDITNPVAIKGNITLSDPKTYIGLVTVSIGDENTVAASFAGNVTLDDGSLTGIVGNITVEQVDVVTTVTAVTDITNPVALKGNVTLSDPKTYIGLTTTTPATAWPDPKTYIGLVTITGSLAAAAGNITLDGGSQTQILGNVTVDQVDVVTAVTDITNPVALKGNLTIDSQTAWTDPGTYIGLVTITGSLAAAAGNITLDGGSLTGILGNVTIEDGGESITVDGDVGLVADAFAGAGNVTVDLVDTVTTVTAVTAVTDITNPIAIKGNITVEQVDVVTLVTAVTDITNPVAIKGNITVEQVDLVTAVTDITNPIAIKGNVTLSDPKTYIGLVTITPTYISGYTSIQKVVSADGQTAISVAVASNFFVLKDLIVSSLGAGEVKFQEGNTDLTPFMSLATQGGFVSNFGDAGMRAGTANTALNANLNGAATVSITANLRFET